MKIDAKLAKQATQIVLRHYIENNMDEVAELLSHWTILNPETAAKILGVSVETLDTLPIPKVSLPDGETINRYSIGAIAIYQVQQETKGAN